MKPGSSSKKRSVAIGAVCALLTGLLASPGAATATAAAPVAQASIIGGEVAAIADFPSLAYIAASTGKNEGFACTGTVIAPRLILTAAHCVEDLDVGGPFTAAADYAVATGQANPRQTPRDQILRVSETHVFPGFDPGNTHGDAALLVLSRPTAAPAIPLASAADSALYAGGAEVLQAGWGLTRPNGSGSEVLRSTSTVVLDGSSCKRRARAFNPSYASSLQMCTTDPPDHDSGGCFGDSGGPALAHRADGSLVEIGITSTGGPGCSTKLPNIFTRTDTISTWAAEWVAAVEAGAPPPSLKPRLPGLSTESAEGFVGAVLRAELGNLFLRSNGLRGRCDRLGPPRVRCELAWVHGSKIYFANVTVFYVLRDEAVGWDNSFVVQRVSSRCFQSNHRQTCAFQTKRG